jgi:IS1 family transposase
VNRAWIWIALCRKTRQVIARAIGDRSKDTCLILWNNIRSASIDLAIVFQIFGVRIKQ